ncbi:MAG: hypothetical protein ACLGG5_01530 [Thermoleophilia bacterium]
MLVNTIDPGATVTPTSRFDGCVARYWEEILGSSVKSNSARDQTINETARTAPLRP